jgi:hypothetical protein
MSANLLDAAAYPVWSSNKERWAITAKFTIGGSGAIAASVVDDSGISGDTFASGVCALTYPACSTAVILCSLVSDGTVQEVVLTARTPTSGSATIKTTKAGVATEPESGAVITVRVFGTVDGATT